MITTEPQPIKLVKDTIDTNDFKALSEWIATEPKLSKDKLVKEFEERFAVHLGMKYAVMVNSGSSANLLMLHALSCTKQLKNKKIVIPAVSWATDLAPVMQLGLDPYLCDINLADLSVDLLNLQEIFVKEKPAAFILVSVLGLVPNMDKVVELCNKYDVILLLDNCEGLGSKYKENYLEKYASMSTTSLYIGHIISTGEGGVIVTDNEQLYEVLLMTRAHGWDRDLSDERKETIRLNYEVNAFDALYTFYLPGFNFRPTEINGFLGLRQLDKLQDFINKRNENFKLYTELLNNEKDIIVPELHADKFVSNLGYPIISRHRNKIAENLQKNNIECRPLISGNLALHPVWKYNYDYKNVSNLITANVIHRNGMYLPNNPQMTSEEIHRVVEKIKEVLS